MFVAINGVLLIIWICMLPVVGAAMIPAIIISFCAMMFAIAVGV